MLQTAPAPKQRRSLATRARLVAAAAEILVEHGLAGATTPRIAERARMSQGALFKHFPTKDAILAAAVEAMLHEFVAAFVRDMAHAAGGDAVTRACAALWKIFRSREMRAVFEVYIAARTDDAIAVRLAPILERHRDAILAQARALFPARPGERAQDFESAVDAIVYSMQGAAIGLFAPRNPLEPDIETRHLAFLERLARRELGLDAPAPAAAPANGSTKKRRA